MSGTFFHKPAALSYSRFDIGIPVAGEGVGSGINNAHDIGAFAPMEFQVAAAP